MKQRRSYEKPSERKNREKSEADPPCAQARRAESPARGGCFQPPRKIDDKRAAAGMTPFGGERGAGSRQVAIRVKLQMS